MYINTTYGYFNKSNGALITNIVCEDYDTAVTVLHNIYGNDGIVVETTNLKYTGHNILDIIYKDNKFYYNGKEIVVKDGIEAIRIESEESIQKSNELLNILIADKLKEQN